MSGIDTRILNRSPRALSISLRIGRVGITFRTASPAQVRDVRRFYGSFVTEHRPSFWKIDLKIRSARFGRTIPVVRSLKNGVEFRSRRFRARLIEGRKTGSLEIQTIAALGIFLRVFLSRIGLGGNGFLLHSVGVLHKNRAHVFFGKSGAGKSTLARLLKSETLLSDEIVWVCLRQKTWWAYGTPFAGDWPRCSTEGKVLAGLNVLKKSNRWAAQPVEPVEAFRRLMKCVLFFSESPGDHQRLLRLTDRAIGELKMRALLFSKTGRVGAREKKILFG